MNYRHKWYRLKQGLQKNIERNLADYQNPLNHKIEQYLEGKLRQGLMLLGIMIDLERDQPLNTTFLSHKNIIIVKKKKS